MTIFSRESDLTLPVERFLARRSFRRSKTELQFFEYRVDLYAVSRQSGKSVAVEMKLSKWSRAIEQALVYQLCADIVYLAMPASARASIPLDQLTRHGIGLILAYPTMCREILSPSRSSAIRPDYADYYRGLLLASEVT